MNFPRPSLLILTVPMDVDDVADAGPVADELGRRLFDLLTRPLSTARRAGVEPTSDQRAADMDERVRNAVSFGPQIRVRVGVHPDVVNRDDAAMLRQAERVVVVPVLGSTAHQLRAEQTLAQIEAWAAAGARNARFVPVITASQWMETIARLPEDHPLRTNPLDEVLNVDEPSSWAQTVDDLLWSFIIEMEGGNEVRLPLYVSCAKDDHQAEPVVDTLRKYIGANRIGNQVFELEDRTASPPMTPTPGRGVFLGVRGDRFALGANCQKQLLRAKRVGLPTIRVERVVRGEPRTSPIAGNGLSTVWDDDPARLQTLALVAWLHHLNFHREADRLIAYASLPKDTLVLTRPPEGVDVGQGPVSRTGYVPVLFPDPELPVHERGVLLGLHPKLISVTPSTAYRRVLGPDQSEGRFPLGGLQVALSLSKIPDHCEDEGLIDEHVEDATVHLARCLISSGAAIAYGGHLRKVDERTMGYTRMFDHLVDAYNDTAPKPSELLHSYLAAGLSPTEGRDLNLTMHHLAHSEDARAIARLADLDDPGLADTSEATERLRDALGYSDMRFVMAEMTDARVVIGGKTEPRGPDHPHGYRGPVPGVVEEAWRTLQEDKPLYVAGGFGGAARLVVDVLEGRETPELTMAQWSDNAEYTALVQALGPSKSGRALGMPRDVDDLARRIRSLGRRLLESDDLAVAANGLTVEENRVLMYTSEPSTLAFLVLKGLTRWFRKRSEGKLAIELVRGSVATPSELDAIALAVFDKTPLAGAARDLDARLDGKLSLERASRELQAEERSGPEGRRDALISTGGTAVDARTVFLADLGAFGPDGLSERIEAAARSTAAMVERQAFRKLGVTSFGGSLVEEASVAAQAMVDGLVELGSSVRVVWFELDPARFDELREHLGADDRVQLSTRIATSKPLDPKEMPPPSLTMVVTALNAETYSVVLDLPQQGQTTVHQRTIPPDTIDAWAKGTGSYERSAPPLEALVERGRAIAAAFLGEQVLEDLPGLEEASLDVVHDVQAARIPFELMAVSRRSGGTWFPAIGGFGLNRRLALPGIPLDQLVRPPRNPRTLRLLLVADPTQDLPNAASEAEELRERLGLLTRSIELIELAGPDATEDRVAEALQSADILHYTGHAFYDGPGPHESGLVLHGGVRFTAHQLEGLTSLPRLVFANGCESARVLRSGEALESFEAANAFTTLMLRRGVEAYVGTYWTVGDWSAAQFASELYALLASGESLNVATRLARHHLFDEASKDWGNYLLYGNANFRLVNRRSSRV